MTTASNKEQPITMITTLTRLLKNHIIMLSFVLFISLFSLAAALIAEHAFALKPCVLCLYQRFPFAAAIALALLGLRLRRYKDVSAITLLLCGLSFLANSALALYHTGVEQKWWVSAFEGCKAPNLGDNPTAIIDHILKQPAVPCDEIPWSDPIIGLSMANYNAMMCLGLSMLCFLSVILIRKSLSDQHFSP